MINGRIMLTLVDFNCQNAEDSMNSDLIAPVSNSPLVRYHGFLIPCTRICRQIKIFIRFCHVMNLSPQPIYLS